MVSVTPPGQLLGPADVLAEEGAARRLGRCRESPPALGCGHREEAAGPQQGSETRPHQSNTRPLSRS